MTDRAAVNDWLTRYLVAWDSNDPADIRDLFTPDGSYRFHPWDEPTVGHDAITAAWLDSRDDVDDHAFSWEILAVDDATAVIQAHTTYSAGSFGGREFDNLWIVRLAPDGRATAFTEWYMERAKPATA